MGMLAWMLVPERPVNPVIVTLVLDSEIFTLISLIGTKEAAEDEAAGSIII